MTQVSLASVLQHLRTLAQVKAAGDLTDGALLERFSRYQEEAAFTILLHRHGPMVLAACRRVLGNPHDAEDAFQATFLVLVRKAASIRKGNSLASWLYGVAQRVAAKARAQSASRRGREQRSMEMAKPQPLDEKTWQEFRAVLDQELAELPAKYQAPLVLCYLEGKSQEQSARELGCPRTSLASRLGRARKLLRERLVRRGIVFPAGALAGALTEAAAAARVPALLTIGTARAAVLAASGTTVAAGAISQQAMALAEGVVKAMAVSKVKLGMALLVALGVLATGTGLVYERLAGEQQPAQKAAAQQPPERPADRPRADPKPKPRTDRYGDPLPPGAIARLGTEAEAVYVAFSPRNHLLATAGWGEGIPLWDSSNGRLVGALSGPSGCNGLLAFSLDGKLLYVAENKTLRVWEAATGKVERSFAIEPGYEAGPGAGYARALSQDGQQLAAGGKDGAIRLYDVARGRESRQLNWHQAGVLDVAFSRDGKALASCGADGIIRLGRLDGTREPLRFVKTDPDMVGWYQRDIAGRMILVQQAYTALAFSPDGKTLVSAGYYNSRNGFVAVGTLEFWDTAAGKFLRRLPEAREHGKPVALAFSPDGKTLAVGYHDRAVRLFDPRTGKLGRPLEKRRTRTSGPYRLAFSPDGKTLAAGGSEMHTAHLWDVPSGRLLQQKAPGHEDTIRCLAVSPDGKVVATGSQDQTICLWDSDSGRLLRRLEGHDGFLFMLAISPDGKLLASASSDGTARLWDIATGQMRRRFDIQRVSPPRANLPAVHNMMFAVSFSPDGTLLAAADCVEAPGVPRLGGTAIVLWQTDTGKQLQRLPVNRTVHTLSFSPDCKTLRAAGWGKLDSWDVATGKHLMPPSPTLPILYGATYSPDGRLVASYGSTNKAVRLVEVASGKTLRLFEVPRVKGIALAFSPDHRYLACCPSEQKPTSDLHLHLFELATGKEALHLPLPPDSDVRSGAILADSRRLVTGMADTTGLVWDLTGLKQDGRTPAKPLLTQQGQALWMELAGGDAAKAHLALWQLVAAGDQAVAFLKKQLRRAVGVDPQRLAGLIANLFSGQFSVRDKAGQELAELGELAEESLRKLLAGKPRPEVRRRVEALLQKLEGPVTSPERLEAVRGVEVLEHIGSPEAKKVLKDLAQGFPQARLTREAKAALERLARRRVVSR